MASPSDLLNPEGALLIATALEVALFGKSEKGTTSEKLDRIERCGGARREKNRKPLASAQRLELLLTAAVSLPPVVDFSPDSDPSKTLFLAWFPFQVVGIFDTREAALESLRPFVQAHNEGGKTIPKPTGPHCFQPPMALEAMRSVGLPNYVEAAGMAMMYAQFRKPAGPGEKPLGPDYYVQRLPRSMPRTPGVDYTELTIAAEKQDDSTAMVLLKLKWGPEEQKRAAAAPAAATGAGGAASSAAAAAVKPSEPLSPESALLIATALEVALFGKSEKGTAAEKLDRIERCSANKKAGKDKKPLEDSQRLELLLTAAVALPPIVEFPSESDPSKTLFLAWFPYQVVGIFDTREAALDSLRPYIRACKAGKKDVPAPTGPHCFQPARALMMMRYMGLMSYVDAAAMAVYFPQFSKPLGPGESAVGPEFYLERLPKTMPRVPGRDFTELTIADETETNEVVLRKLRWDAPDKGKKAEGAASASTSASSADGPSSTDVD